MYVVESEDLEIWLIPQYPFIEIDIITSLSSQDDGFILLTELPLIKIFN